eukprot:TRINITY_DN4798_c0_g1_i3.p1 TRINITY_DN4798_c0_g1~~TRINITY_DN4798_c0_g1_i3.p1  ORF type:complete len:109 (-),score=25.59 TRINITY_DN4798_c0_g1_i3:132-458(-)
MTGESVWEAPDGATIQPGETYQPAGGGEGSAAAAEGGSAYEAYLAAAKAKALAGEGDFSEEASKELWDQKQAHAEVGGVGAWGFYSDNFKEARKAEKGEVQYVGYDDH